MAIFDKIIIRRALHHFSNPTAMLYEIRKDLKTNGELLIFETVKNTSDIVCSASLTDKQILKLLRRNDFRFVDKWANGSNHFYRFVK